MTTLFLAADIGATKTDLAVYSSTRGPDNPLLNSTLPTTEYTSFEDMLAEFLSVGDYAVKRAVFAVAGPVINGCVPQTITHLPWDLDQAHLRQNLRLDSLELLNDLEAVALAIPRLKPDDLHILSPGQPEERGALAVIAPGTGLGEAFLLWNGQEYRACISEGGNVNFASTTPFEAELCRYLQNTYGYASYEMVCSGMGLANIYACLKAGGYAEEPSALAKQLANAPDPTPIIIRAALAQNPPEICTLALQTFISVLGAEAGNLALKVVATGGVYLGGGIPRRILPLLEQEKAIFMAAFTQKWIMTKMMVNIPVKVITHPHAALLGAAQMFFLA